MPFSKLEVDYVLSCLNVLLFGSEFCPPFNKSKELTLTTNQNKRPKNKFEPDQTFRFFLKKKRKKNSRPI